MRFSALLLATLAAAQFAAPAVLSVEPQEQLKDPALEFRARQISAGLRCLVCQNQSIDDSDAGLAKDLRLLVRQRLSTGSTDEDVVRYVVARYGDFVLLKPPFDMRTGLLWGAPLVLLGVGSALALKTLKRTSLHAHPQALTDDEKRELEDVLVTPPRPRNLSG